MEIRSPNDRLTLLRGAAWLILLPLMPYSLSQNDVGLAGVALLSMIAGVGLVEWYVRRRGWVPRGDRYILVVLQVCVFLLGGVIATWGLGEDVPWAVAAGVLLALVGDAALARVGGARGKELAVDVAQAVGLAAFLLGSSAVTTMLDSYSISLGSPYILSHTVIIQMAVIVLALAGTAVLRPWQAAILWLVAGGSLLSGLTAQGSAVTSMFGVDALVTPLPFTVLYSVMAFGSTGLLALYLRRVTDRRSRTPRALLRLALAGAVVIGALALAAGICVYFVSLYNESSYSEEARVASIVAGELGSDFGTRTVDYRVPVAGASGVTTLAPGLAPKLIRLARSAYAGVSVVDRRTGAVLAAVRSVETTTNGPSELRVITLSGAEAAAIVAGIAHYDAASAPPTWPFVAFTPIGDVDGPLVAVATSQQPDWQNEPASSTLDSSMSFFEQFFPWIFTVLLIPSALALLLLERRDRAMAKLLFAQERARLSRDAHDRVYNRMTALANRLESGAAPEGGAPAPADQVRGALSDLQRILGDVDARTAAGADTGVELFDDLVGDQADRWGMAVALEGRDALAGLDPRLAWDLQCVVEEALTNAGKHGPASHVVVAVERAAGVLRIRVSDDGPGIAQPLGADGLPAGARGLRGVKERLDALGGRMQLSGEGGATVSVEVPLS